MNEHFKSILYMAIAGVLLWLFLPEKYTVNAPIPLANSISEQEALERLDTPDNFSISVYANKLPNVRALVVTNSGDLIVSRPNTGELTLVYSDSNNDGLSDGNKLLLKGLNRPHGITIHDNWLYIAETNAVLKIKYDAKQRKLIGTPHYIIRDSFPGGGNHWVRSIKVGPDNKLYVSVGSSCNACKENSPKRASILQYDLDGKNETIYATGLRNTTGFDWQPKSQLMFGVDNGRDYLGDDTPPEELNQIIKGHHYGWPYVYGNNIIDQDFKDAPFSRLTMTPPVHEMAAHSAPLGLLFLKKNKALKNTALVALHGSWNRSTKSGYKVVSLSFSKDKEITQKDFISGFEIDDIVLGRPVDLAEDQHGNIYISDDYRGRIYKVTSLKIEK